MLESITTGRIVDALDRLTGEVSALKYEVARHREKLGPQPEWLLFMLPASVIVLSVALVIIAAAKNEPSPRGQNARIEAQVEQPDAAAR